MKNRKNKNVSILVYLIGVYEPAGTAAGPASQSKTLAHQAFPSCATLPHRVEAELFDYLKNVSFRTSLFASFSITRPDSQKHRASYNALCEVYMTQTNLGNTLCEQ